MNLFPVMVLAGGLATRLRPMTETIPKALIDINGEPFIAHQLKLLHQQGLREVVICVGHLADRLQSFLGDGSQYGMKVQYSSDGEALLGTAGALKKALPLVGENFFVLYGDSYLPCDYQLVQQAFYQQKKLGLMTLFHNAGKWDTSNVEYEGGMIIAYDKKKPQSRMHYIDYGLGVFNQQAFDKVPTHTHYDLAELYQKLLQSEQLGACEVKERFYEVGSFSGIEEIRSLLCNS